MGSAIGSKHFPVTSIDKNCFIIAVVGLTGTGKSTFINTAVGSDILRIGHSLKPETLNVNYVDQYDPESSDKRRVVFVDTPGFDSEREEQIVERKIRKWFKEMLRADKKLKISGILYLHRITDPKLSHPPIRHLTLLRTSCEASMKGFPNRVILVTTMWGMGESTQQQSVYESREMELQRYWDMLPSGSVVSRVMRFDQTPESAWKIVCTLRGIEYECD